MKRLLFGVVALEELQMEIALRVFRRFLMHGVFLKNICDIISHRILLELCVEFVSNMLAKYLHEFFILFYNDGCRSPILWHGDDFALCEKVWNIFE